MDNRSRLDAEYSKFVSSNPDKKFILYLRTHPEDEKEKIFMNELSKKYGEYKELERERTAIFITEGKRVNEFIDKLNSSETGIYLSYIQSEEELNNKKNKS